MNCIGWSALFLTIAFLLRYAAEVGSFKEILGVLFITIIFGAAFSWLIFLLCYFVFRKMTASQTIPLKKIKKTISILAIAAMLVMCIFFEIDFTSLSFDLAIPFCYLLAILTATGATRLDLSNRILSHSSSSFSSSDFK